ncbi:putative double-stranded RNA-binding domain-containing protein [Lupinus albus]|uniref:Putative double-stranded RNA-binding domain-containing protein n=1 Tax=Lupinus albus TaxID=3870 RepID=A0A6A4NHM0_LUPAL|nr:putative double-stranded RNA-binding domain-containing protein [Lupinus albus]
MYKNQLQELAQRSCFNLPSYTCIREGPDHAPRFKATVNFNGEIFDSPHYCTTLRQAEHSAAEVALNSLSHRGPSHSLAARILDETGVYKNLLQEIAQRVGAPLPQYTTFRSGLGHLPVFTGTVELAGITFTGEPAKNKKQAEKNAAMAAWSYLKQLVKGTASSSTEPENNDELEQITIARALLNYRLKEKIAMSNPNDPIPFPKRFQFPNSRPTSPQPPPAATSKILPLICPKTVPRSRHSFTTSNESPRIRHPVAAAAASDNPIKSPFSCALESRGTNRPKFPAVGAAPYVPIRQMRSPCQGIAPPVTIRTAIPVFSAPPLPPPAMMAHQVMRAPPVRVAPSVNIRQAVPVYAAPPPVRKDEPVPIREDDPPAAITVPSQEDKLPATVVEDKLPATIVEDKLPATIEEDKLPATVEEDKLPATIVQGKLLGKSQEMDSKTQNIPPESETAQSLEQLKI